MRFDLRRSELWVRYWLKATVCLSNQLWHKGRWVIPVPAWITHSPLYHDVFALFMIWRIACFYLMKSKSKCIKVKENGGLSQGRSWKKTWMLSYSLKEYFMWVLRPLLTVQAYTFSKVNVNRTGYISLGLGIWWEMFIFRFVGFWLQTFVFTVL